MEYIVVGLGNPGKEYEHSRHNVGMFFLDEIARAHSFADWDTDKKKKAQSTKGTIDGNSFRFIKPLTYMNDSGLAVKHFVKTPAERARLVVINDDLDLPFGEARLVFARGSAGHKGVTSVSKVLKSDEYFRIRIGISAPRAKGGVKKPPNKKGVTDFVLKDFSKKELTELKARVPAIKQALISVASGTFGKKPTRFSTSI
jgi:PTH1 family peptidyl-tRNA hydrolase